MDRGGKRCKTEKKTLGECPKLVVDRIMRVLAVRDVLALSATCRRIYQISSNQRLWKWLVERDFGVLEKLTIDLCWKTVYKEEHLVSFKIADYPAFFASIKYHRELNLNRVKCGLRHKIDPNVKNKLIIRWAADNGHVDMIKLLLADPRLNPSDHAIQKAAEKGYTEIVWMLLADGRVDPAEFDNYAIQKAAENGHTEVVQLLLADPRVDPSDSNNWAIRWAAKRGHVDVVKLLLADPRVRNLLPNWTIQQYQYRIGAI